MAILLTSLFIGLYLKILWAKNNDVKQNQSFLLSPKQRINLSPPGFMAENRKPSRALARLAAPSA